MPCMGPNLAWARREGRDTGQRILKEIIKDEKMWGPIYNKNTKGPTKDELEWETAKENFVKSVEELFVLDAIYSF